MSVWRSPREESVDLYPGLVVHDGRVSGSITIGQSRLPIWAITTTAIRCGWDDVEDGWGPGEHYGFTQQHFADFIYDLVEARGEFARLLLVIADAQRNDRVTGRWKPWWEVKRHRVRVSRQLQRCLDALAPDLPEAS